MSYLNKLKKCNLCGSPMRLNKPVGNNTTWDPFYGCIKYPKCKFTLKLDGSAGRKPKPLTAGLDWSGKVEPHNAPQSLPEGSRGAKVDKARVQEVRKRRRAVKGKVEPVWNASPQEFPYCKFPYKEFNPMQRDFLPLVDQDVNVIVCSPTSSGKTSVAEMVIGRTLKEDSMSIYLSPLKALSQQKFDRWIDPSHSFSKKRISLQIGDVHENSKHKLVEYDIVIMTSEMLHHRSLHLGDHNNWLLDVGCLVVDEAHLIDEESRGSELECGLERFTKINPECRLLFLSATMENLDEIKKWLTTLNGKETKVVDTKYRPCELEIHWHRVPHDPNYKKNQENLIDAAVEQVQRNENDKHIVFVHTKQTGYKLVDALRLADIETRFHSADADRKERNEIENDFLNGKLQTVVATPTLAMGLDFPARRVVIVGTTRGPDRVKHSQIAQECGRAGRPMFDTKGDAHILISANIFQSEKARIQRPFKISSTLTNGDNLTFHVLFAIYGGCKNKKDIHEWYHRTLSHIQNRQVDDTRLDQIVAELKNMGMVKLDDHHEFVVQHLGKICCWFYISPYDVYAWYLNLKSVRQAGLFSSEAFAFALSSGRTYIRDIVNAAQKGDLAALRTFTMIPSALTRNYVPTDGHNKHFGILYCLMNGIQIPKSLFSSTVEWKSGIDRIIAATKTIDSMVGSWGISNYLDRIAISINNDIPYDYAELALLDGIGRVRARRLVEAGIFTIQDILKNKEKIKFLGPGISKSIYQQALKLRKK